MKSVEFLIDSRLGGKKLVIFTPKKGGKYGPESSSDTNVSSQTTYHLNVEEIPFPKMYIVAWFRQGVIL